MTDILCLDSFMLYDEKGVKKGGVVYKAVSFFSMSTNTNQIWKASL